MEEFKYPYKFTKAGKFMYRTTYKWSKFILNKPFLYFFLQFTWGILTTTIGLLFDIAMLITFHKPHKFGYQHYYIAGSNNWGGLSIGLTIIVDKAPLQSLTNHEHGHSYQNTLWGPFTLFLVTIPSFIRYWVITIKENKAKKQGKIYRYTYDAIWFEAHATAFGNEAAKELNIKL